MKNCILLSVLTLALTSCNVLKKSSTGQNLKTDIEYFNKGATVFEIIEETNFDYDLEKIDTTTAVGRASYEALFSKREDLLDFAFDQFENLTHNYPKSKLYHKSVYNLAHISSLMGLEEDEIEYLKVLLDSGANDKESSGRSGIMSNPYANYKNEASNRLTQIYINNGNFNEALNYKRINEKYPFQHFCGNAFAANKIYNAIQYAKIYNGLGDSKKASTYLLPNIFNNDLANNSDLVELTIETIKDSFDLITLRNGFNESIENILLKVEKQNDDEWNIYYIKYLDTEIEIPSWTLSFETDQEKVKSEIKKAIQESKFYHLINK